MLINFGLCSGHFKYYIMWLWFFLKCLAMLIFVFQQALLESGCKFYVSFCSWLFQYKLGFQIFAKVFWVCLALFMDWSETWMVVKIMVPFSRCFLYCTGSFLCIHSSGLGLTVMKNWGILFPVVQLTCSDALPRKKGFYLHVYLL